MMKRMILLPAAAGLMMMTAGCASEQVLDKHYVRAAAIMGAEQKTAVFAFYDEKTKPCGDSGEGLNQICKKSELKLGKSLFTGHTELVILGECDYEAVLEELLNEWRVSPSCLIAFGGDDSGKLLEEYDPERLADSIEHAVDQGEAEKCDIVTVLSGLLGDENSAEIPVLGESGFVGEKVIYGK